MQEDHLVGLFNDIQSAIKAYATEHKIDLVVGYGEPHDKALNRLFPNINRKMQAMDGGGVVPLFLAPHVDISADLTKLLNKRARNE